MAKKTGKAASKKTAGKAGVKKTAVTASATKPRRIKLGKYQSLRLQKRIKHPIKLPSAWRLTKQTAVTLWRFKRLFIGVTLIYGLLNLVLAQGVGGTDVSSLKHSLDQVFNGHFGAVFSGLSVFALLVGSAGNTTSQTAGAYQIVLAFIASLAIIWTLRQVLSGGARPRVRDAYYRGMYPLIPFILVLLVISLQLIPLVIGSALYTVVINNGIAVYGIEKFLWMLLFLALALLTLYMLSSSLFALYIVTLPDMTPMKALRSARELVRYRRWTVLRKILCLPVILLVVAAVIMLPVIVILTPLAQWVFFLLTMFALLAVHAYMYTLYRELLNE